MFNCVKFKEIEDYFKNYSNRETKGVYFYRLTSYNNEIKTFLAHYVEEVKKQGIYIKGKIQNPNEQQLAFFEEMIGLNFHLEETFFNQVLERWLPRLNHYQRTCVIDSMFSTLMQLKKEGKNETVLKNAYIKYMCWFYYKFERILTRLGSELLPKIIYEGTISSYELKILKIIANTGCDILLVQWDQETEYRKVDPKSIYTTAISIQNAQPLPMDFSLVNLNQEPNKSERELSSVTKNVNTIFTNTWLSGDLFEDSLKKETERGKDSNSYYNLFARIHGVLNEKTYLNDLLRWKMKLEANKRKVVIIEQRIEMPTVSEVQKISRGKDTTIQQLILNSSKLISFPKSKELENLARNAFVQLMQEENSSIQKLSNRAVCLLCWLDRYSSMLFESGTIKTLPTLIYYGVCKNENEAFFIRLLARMPIDVILICPDLDLNCKLKDSLLFEQRYELGLKIEKFPREVETISFGTVAYEAEQDLNTILYQDTGMYRNLQFKKAIPIRLQTIYEEIDILWNQEAKYRPNFEVLDDRVMVPVIFTKISGVKDGNRISYWEKVEKLINEDTFLVKVIPYIKRTDENPIKQYVTSFLKNGIVQVQKIKQHPSYQYGFMREEMQDYMFDKLQQLIDSKIISCTNVQGIEYTILSTILNLEKSILRLIQKYDFTKQIPKFILVHTTEDMCSLEDSILVAYLSLIGFDIALFIPTGYQSVEKFYSKSLLIEYQIGDYIYDMNVPNFGGGWKQAYMQKFTNIFKRGR